MKIFTKMSTLIIFLISLFLFSCGASHHLRKKELYRDKNFNYESLKNDGLIIGGISSQKVDLTPEQRLQYGDLMAEVFRKQLKDGKTMTIMNTSLLAEKIGHDKYIAIMGKYDDEKMFWKETMDLVRESMHGAKYCLLGYIENESIIDKSFEQYIENSEGEEELSTTFKKTYLFAIEFRIYDLEQEEIVRGDIIYNEAKQSETRTTDSGCVEGCMDELIQLIILGEPASISRKEVLKKTVKEFANDLNPAGGK
ncbi:hypothetical protein JW935_17295 [candidate division KSB1 bacterium]|nr:hypothetical protein [candidate division KSB1 bacterium]